MNELIYYKYKADTKYTEEILTSGKVYLSTAAGLNDPFECSLQEIGNEWIIDHVNKLQQASVGGFIFAAIQTIKNKTSFFGLPRKETVKLVKRIRSIKDIGEAAAFREKFILKHTGHPPANNEKLFSQIDNQLQSVGIFSMSVKPDHPLMWAHYGNDHNGLCLGFKKNPGSRLSDENHFLPVNYSDKLPEMSNEGFNVQMAFSVDDSFRLYTSSYKIAFSDKTFQSAIVTKPTCWSYEEEWRYIEPFSGLFDWPGQLNDITFGLRCKEERIKHYIKLTEENVPYPVNFYCMRKKRGSNDLERVPFEQTSSKPKVILKPEKFDNKEMQKIPSNKFIDKMERLIKQEHFGEVIFQVGENLKLNPNDPVLLDLKGTAHGFAQEPEKALQCFIKLTELKPEMATSWYQTACAFIDLKRDEEAIEALKIAYKLDPDDPSISYNLGIEILKIQGSPDEALTYLKRADKLGHRRAYNIISQLEE